MQYNFEWDPRIATSNSKKHGITFEEAVGGFKDPMALSLYEGEDSAPGEDRWITLGLVSDKGLVSDRRYIVVVHTYQASSSITIRVISARRATRREIKQYEQGQCHA